MKSDARQHNIVILDDDHFPEGRVSVYILPEFERRGIHNVKHYKTYHDLKGALEKGAISPSDLFVVDSSLGDEPDGRYVNFEIVIPSLLGMHGISHKNILPASGGDVGMFNNQWFFDYLERIGKGWDWGQEGLKSTGLTGRPKDIVETIVNYFESLHPGEIKSEVRSEVDPDTEGIHGRLR